MTKILKSILRAAVDLLEQSERMSGTVREAFSKGVDRAGDRVADVRKKARDLYGHEDHTIRNVISFTAGVGVGVGVAMLFTPSSGREIRDSISGRATALRDRVRDHFTTQGTATESATEGTEGL